MIVVVLSALFLVANLVSHLPAAGAPKSDELTALEVLQGEIAELQISADGIISMEATMGQEPVHFFRAENGAYHAVIGADVAAKPGLVKILLRSVTTGGVSRERRIDIRIKPKAFKQESFTVASEFDQFTPELLERIRREREQFAQAYASSVSTRYWEKPFLSPVPVEITSPFGYRRVINGSPRSPHSGTDLKAPMGTEILVSNHGRVVLTGDFYFAGKSVVVDHGAGVITMYFHLSEIKVAQGAAVRKGDVIALSGMTGRVTGPHLHWAARVGGARVDPLELIEKLGNNDNKAFLKAAGGAEK